MLAALNFPFTTNRLPNFGDLPITTIGTGSPPRVLLTPSSRESAELTGMDAFEEAGNLEDIHGGGNISKSDCSRSPGGRRRSWSDALGPRTASAQ